MAVGALVAHHPDRSDVGKHGERLPDLAFEPGQAQFLTDDRVGLLQQRHPLRGDLADDPHPETGAREGLAPHHLVGQAELGAEFAHLVLEQLTQWLDEFEFHVVGQPTDVVVTLDHRCRTVDTAALDQVGIQRALHQPLGVGEPAGVLLEHPDELFTDRLALGLGLGDTFERREKSFAGVDVDQFDTEVATERLDHLGALALAHQTGVDVDAGELVADRLVHERRRHRRIDPTGESADHPVGADTLADLGDLLVDHGRHLPVVRDAGALVEEPCHHRHPVRRVHHFGMELHAVDPAVVVLQHRHGGTRRGGCDRETLGHFGDAIEVAHPHVVLRWCIVWQQRRRAGSGHPRTPVLALHATTDDSAELLADQLRSVADPEHRHSQVVDRRIERRGAVDVHALGAAGQDDRGRFALGDLGGGDAMRDDFGVHLQLTHPPGDQLGVLGAEVDDENGGAVVMLRLTQGGES